MSEFIWQDDYKIGHATVDMQHRQLFDLANKTVEATTSEALIHMFALFYQHLREHFEAEEQLMKHHGYPNYARHVATHNLMLDKLNDISQTVYNRQWKPADINAFVRQWVLVHILEEDKLLGEYLKNLPA